MNHCDEEIKNIWKKTYSSGEVRRICSQHSGKNSHGLMESPHFLGYVRIKSNKFVDNCYVSLQECRNNIPLDSFLDMLVPITKYRYWFNYITYTLHKQIIPWIFWFISSQSWEHKAPRDCCTLWFQSFHAVDGRNPAPPGTYRTLETVGRDKLPINWCRIFSINSINMIQYAYPFLSKVYSTLVAHPPVRHPTRRVASWVFGS